MALPESIRVKISSEAAESINLVPVVVRQMPLRELVEAMLGSTGKSAPRLSALLRSGSYVSGASRFRWEAFTPDPAALDLLLETFPDSDPLRPFLPDHCVRVLFKGPNTRIEITRDAARERRLLRKRSFWDAVLDFARAAPPRYVEYSYHHRADLYEADVDAASAAALRNDAGTLRYTTLEAQVRQARIDRIEFFVERPA